MAVRKSETSKEQWQQMLEGAGAVEIGPGKEEIVEIHAGEEMTGYLHLLLDHGPGARIQILQSESYVHKEMS